MVINMYDLIIIGSGPAGLSAAVYAKRAGFHTLVLEKSPMSGGQALNTYEVDNYLGLPGINGFDLGMKFREHADKMEVEFIETEAKGIITGIEAGADAPGGRIHTVKTDQGDFQAKAVLLATGAQHAKLGAPGEEELAGMGVSYCATCDGAFFRNRTVAVVGGGDVAAEDAIFLGRICRKVYLLHRRDELRAAATLQERVKNQPQVEILWNTVVTEIVGEDQVSGVRIRNVASGETQELAVDGVFIAVGIRPDSEAFREIAECDGKGYFVAGEDCATSTPGIYAAGDVRTKALRQIITAVADGANAVASVQDYFNASTDTP